MRFYVSYELYAPAKDEWILHVTDLSTRMLGNRWNDDPAGYARHWWDDHLSTLWAKGELRNYRADYGHPVDHEDHVAHVDG